MHIVNGCLIFLVKLKKRIDVSNYDTYQKRVYGFLGERLLRVWLVNNTFNIKENLLLIFVIFKLYKN